MSLTAPVPAVPTVPEPAPARVRIEPWPDPVIDAVGHDPRSAYVERFWLPVLGPKGARSDSVANPGHVAGTVGTPV